MSCVISIRRFFFCLYRWIFFTSFHLINECKLKPASKSPNFFLFFLIHRLLGVLFLHSAFVQLVRYWFPILNTITRVRNFMFCNCASKLVKLSKCLTNFKTRNISDEESSLSNFCWLFVEIGKYKAVCKTKKKVAGSPLMMQFFLLLRIINLHEYIYSCKNCSLFYVNPQ